MSEPELAPSVASEEPSEKEEQLLGDGEAAKAANLALLALARAARSFLVYDARNDAIRGFLQDWKESMQGFARVHGALELEVRPFELLYAGQVVYLERDRERSLAFRLFRDGVRALSVSATAPWDEQLRLLEILSIRYTGVRQQEDDIVTLLWKAGFTEIQVEAVEGVVLDGGQEARGPRRRGLRIEAPRDRDQPHPTLLDGEPNWRVLPIEEVVALRQDEDTRQLGTLCVRLVERLMGAVRDPSDPAQAEELIPLIEEVREFMLGEQQLTTLLELLDLLREGLPPHISAELTRGFASQRSLGRIVRSIQHNHHEVPSELLQLLERVPGEHLRTAANLLASDRDPDSRRINRQLVEHLGRHQPQVLMDLVLAAPEGAVTDLFRAAHKAAPELCLSHCVELSRRGDADLQKEIHRYLDDEEVQGDLVPLLFSLCDAQDGKLRVKALEMLAKRKDKRVFAFLLERLDSGLGQLPERESDAIGSTLALQDPGQAGELFVEWVRPKKLLGRFFGGTTPTQVRHQWVALSGLEHLPEVDAEGPVKWLQKRAAADLSKRCQGCLIRRRKRLERSDA